MNKRQRKKDRKKYLKWKKGLKERLALDNLKFESIYLSTELKPWPKIVKDARGL